MKRRLLDDEENRIELDTGDNKFYVSELFKETGWSELKSFDTFSDAETYLNNRLDRKAKGTLKKKKPINAIADRTSYGAIIGKVKITSLSPTSYGLNCWISNGKERGKEDCHYLLKDTKKNEEILEKIETLNKEIEELKEQKEKFSKEELKEYFQDD